MSKIIIILDYAKEQVIKIYLSEFDQYVIKNKYDGNIEDWLATRYPDNKLFTWSDMHWMAVSEIKEQNICRVEEKSGLEPFVDEILIDLTQPHNKCWGLRGGVNDECAVNFRFFDGYAVEVDDEWMEIPPSKDPIVMFYPTLSEVCSNDDARRKVEEHTGRGSELTVFDVALTFGKIRRRNKYE